MLCPSAQPDMSGCRVLGVRTATPDGPRIAYLHETVAATSEVLAPAGTAVNQVLRLAAPCEERRCAHFDGTDCRLAERIVTLLPPVIERLPACTIRSECRWYRQEGRAACLRCPQVITEIHAPSPTQTVVATPPS